MTIIPQQYFDTYENAYNKMLREFKNRVTCINDIHEGLELSRVHTRRYSGNTFICQAYCHACGFSKSNWSRGEFEKWIKNQKNCMAIQILYTLLGDKEVLR